MRKIRAAAAELKQAQYAKATRIAYKSDWKTFTAWCESVGRPALPAAAETLMLYVAARLEGGAKVSSTERHMAAICHQHVAAKLPPPPRDDARAILSGARRARKEQPERKAALTPADLRRICKRLDRADTPAAARDKAILTLGLSTGLRRSALMALNTTDVALQRKGITVWIASGKTDQTGKGQLLGVFRGQFPETCPVTAYKNWLRARGRTPGPLFVQIRKTGEITNTRLDPEHVATLVKHQVELLGRDPTHYGAHSLRAGFVTAAHNHGASMLAIMERTGHKSVDMVNRYLRNADPFANNPMAGAL
jgi:integrase